MIYDSRLHQYCIARSRLFDLRRQYIVGVGNNLYTIHPCNLRVIRYVIEVMKDRTVDITRKRLACEGTTLLHYFQANAYKDKSIIITGGW